MFAVSVLGEVSDSVPYVLWGGGLIAAAMFAWWACVRIIPNDRVGVVEKLWSRTGSVGEGRILALDGEAGYQSDRGDDFSPSGLREDGGRVAERSEVVLNHPRPETTGRG